MWKFALVYLGLMLALLIATFFTDDKKIPIWWTNVDKTISSALEKIPKSEGSFKRIELPLRSKRTFQFGISPIYLQPNTSFVLVGPPGAFVLYQVEEGGPTVYRMLPVSYSDKDIAVKRIKFRPVTNKTRLFYGFFAPDRRTAEPEPPQEGEKVLIYGFDQKLTGYLKSRLGYHIIIPADPTPVSKWWDSAVIKTKVNENIAMSIPMQYLLWFTAFLFAGALMAAYFITQKYWTRNIDKPHGPTSMSALWNNGERNFWCPHCARPLEVIGRFDCPRGHVPDEPRPVFDNCDVCTGKIEGIICQSCGRQVNLYKTIYNPEETKNRGQEYISRPDPSKIPFIVAASILFVAFTAMLWLVVVYGFGAPPELVIDDWVSKSMFTDIYRNIYGYLVADNFFFIDPVWGPLYLVWAIYLWMFLTGVTILWKRKEILIENPYR